MSRSLRVLASALVALGAGGGLAAAQAVLGAAPPVAPPELVTDLDGPLFLLQGMVLGDAPVERCVTVRARRGTADVVLLGGRVTGGLAGRVHQEVTAGRAADGADAGRDCESFVPDRTLWSDTLDRFPPGGAPLADSAPLRPGRARVYRFRVRLVGDGPPPLDQLAAQDLAWRAVLDEPGAATAPPPAAVTGTATPPGDTRDRPAPAPPRPQDPACVVQPGERPLRVFVVDGRRVALIVGPVRRLREGEPLTVRLRDPAGVVFRATYELDGRPVSSIDARPWRALLPTSALAAGTSRVRVRVETMGGAVRHGHVDLRSRACAPVVRATALAPRPSSITVDLDLGFAVRHVGLALPQGVTAARQGLRVTSSSRRPVAVGRRDGRVVLGPVRAGTALRLQVPVQAAARQALRDARCAGAELVLRLEPVSGDPRYLRTPLMGRGGGC